MRVLFALLLAQPDPEAEKLACAQAYEAAQVLRADARLIAAKEALVRCASEACPRAARIDCATWLAEVESALPTVTVVVRDHLGADRVDLPIWLDGVALPPAELGRAIPLDPGVHLFEFALPSGERRAERVAIRQGEHNRPLVLAVPPPEPPAPRPALAAPPVVQVVEGPAPAAVALTTVAATSLALFATVGVASLIERSNLEGRCAPGCSDAELRLVRSEQTLADVSLLVALLTGGAAGYLWLAD